MHVLVNTENVKQIHSMKKQQVQRARWGERESLARNIAGGGQSRERVN